MSTVQQDHTPHRVALVTNFPNGRCDDIDTLRDHYHVAEAQDSTWTTPVAKRPWHAHSRAYLLAAVGFMGIFLFGYGESTP